MKASELRIGNYILYNGVKITVNGIFGNTIRYDDNKYHDSNSMGYEPYQPIPLTEEWLERFGFEQGGYDLLFWEKGSPTGVFSISGDDEIGFGVRYNNEIEPPLKYVHQLQNLYFALTGEELTLKEEA